MTPSNCDIPARAPGKVFIYGLRTFRSPEIRYVGSSVRPRVRLWWHQNNGGVSWGDWQSPLAFNRRSAFANWIHCCKASGEYLLMVILECAPLRKRVARERHWIHVHRHTALNFVRNPAPAKPTGPNRGPRSAKKKRNG